MSIRLPIAAAFGLIFNFPVSASEPLDQLWKQATETATTEADEIETAIIFGSAKEGRLRSYFSTPTGEQSIYRIGSLTKILTALSVEKLFEDRRVDRNATISRWLPDLLNADSITFDHLIRHTSGIPDYIRIGQIDGVEQYSPEFMAKDMSSKEVIGIFERALPDFEPGSSWSYSNSNYSTLGYLLEEISGQSGIEFLRQELFPDLELSTLRRSTFAQHGELLGHRLQENAVIKEPRRNLSQVFGSGDLAMSIEDFESILNELLKRDSFLAAASADPELSVDLENPHEYVAANVRAGFYRTNYQGTLICAHRGASPGFTCLAMIAPAFKEYLVAFTNLDDANFRDAERFFRQALSSPEIDHGFSYKIPKKDRSAYAGAYQILNHGSAILELDDHGDLVASTHDVSPRKVEFASPDFARIQMSEAVDVFIRFVRDSNDAIAGALFERKSHEMFGFRKPYRSDKFEVKQDWLPPRLFTGTYRIEGSGHRVKVQLAPDGEALIGRLGIAPPVRLLQSGQYQFTSPVAGLEVSFGIDPRTSKMIAKVLRGENQYLARREE